MPVTIVSNLRRSPHLIAQHYEVPTIINSNFTDEETKQKKSVTKQPRS